jgi:peptidoglycan biosynthesis protein MviN/MurJ (putative lipid II flippase)
MREAGPRGIAVAMSLSTSFQAFLLYVVWNRRTNNTDSRQVYSSFLKMAVLSVGMGGGLEWIRQLLAGILPVGIMGSILLIAGLSGIWLGLLLAIGTFLRSEEIMEPLVSIREEIRRRLSNRR